MNTFYKRQGDKEAIRLYKASTYCYNKEYRLRYVIIFFSLLFCFLGIFLNSYLKLNNLDTSSDAYKTINTLIDVNSIISGFYLILQIFLNIVCIKSHKEAVHLEELYDNYIYEIKPNAYTSKFISEVVIDDYARKIKKSDANFTHKYDANLKDTVFENQKRIVQDNYDTLHYAKNRWLMPSWLFVIILIIIFAILVNDNFMATLRGIFFPSLSAIVMIVNSQYNHTQSTTVVHTCLNSMNKVTIPKPTDVRNVQDAIFNIRVSSFMTPNFISKLYKKNAKKEALQRERILQKERIEKEIKKKEAQLAKAPKVVEKKKVATIDKPVVTPPVAKATTKPSPKVEVKSTVKTETKPIVKTESKPVAKTESKTKKATVK